MRTYSLCVGGDNSATLGFIGGEGCGGTSHNTSSTCFVKSPKEVKEVWIPAQCLILRKPWETLLSHPLLPSHPFLKAFGGLGAGSRNPRGPLLTENRRGGIRRQCFYPGSASPLKTVP